jgi:hypothetical protein
MNPFAARPILRYGSATPGSKDLGSIGTRYRLVPYNLVRGKARIQYREI